MGQAYIIERDGGEAMPSIARALIAQARAVLWDLDGTLMNSGPTTGTYFLQAVRQHGIEVTDQLKAQFRQCWGIDSRLILQRCLPDDDEATHAAILATWRQHDVAQGHALFYHSLPLLIALRRHYPHTIHTLFTNRTWQTTNANIRRSGLQTHLTHYSCAEDAGVAKPHPESWRKLLDTYAQYNIPLDSVVAVGDSAEADYPVAQAHGIHFIGITTGHSSRDMFLEAGLPDAHIIDSLTELMPIEKSQP